MAKKRIGSSKVTDGVARGYFSLPETLGKGVYELIGEYGGTNIYKPSYDIKKLVIGWKTEVLDLDPYYRIGLANRGFKISGRLVGYDGTNTLTPLSNRKLKVKIIPVDNPLNKTDLERYYDATTLVTTTNKSSITTDAEGKFSALFTIPAKFTDWHYIGLIGYEGDNDFVASVQSFDFYIGNCPTYTRLTPVPSYHIHPEGAVIFTVNVFKYEDLNDDGTLVSNAETVKYGNVVIKSSSTGADGTWSTMKDSSGEKMVAETITEDGIVRVRFNPNREANDIFDIYFYAQYSGSSSGIGYSPSQSEVIQVHFDAEGVHVNPINVEFPLAQEDSDVIFAIEGTSTASDIMLNYGDESHPVPNGKVNIEITER